MTIDPQLPQTIEEFERRAPGLLESGPWGYYAGGAADELTIDANIRAWQEMEIRPRVLVDVSVRDPSTRVAGLDLAHPIVVAPTAYHRLAYPEGEEATAAGAASADSVYTLSTLATSTPAAVAASVPDGRKWFQVYVFKDRAVTAALIDEAVDSGFEALVLTVDLPVLGRRDRDIESGFTIGDASVVPGVKAAGGKGLISMQDTADLIDPSLTWSDVEALVGSSPVPVFVKGVLRPDDALLAVKAGVAGLIVSNHGGRQLDTVPATATALPPIAEALGDDCDLLVDGGIRRGTDVLKAMVLGAKAVLVGRPILWGLASSGPAGVTQVIEILRDEFDRALALSGVPVASALAGRSDLVVTREQQAG